MSNPVVVAAARALADAGCCTLCFNWRGTGNSEGVASGRPEDAAADYEAALDALLGGCRSETASKESRPVLIIAAGYSFGSLAAARVARRRQEIRALLLIAPPIAVAGAEEFAGIDLPTAVVTGEADAFAPLPELRCAFGSSSRSHLHVVPGADHFFSTLSLSSLTSEIASAIAGARLLGKNHT